VGLIQKMRQSAGTKFILADWNIQVKNAGFMHFIAKRLFVAKNRDPGRLNRLSGG